MRKKNLIQPCKHTVGDFYNILYPLIDKYVDQDQLASNEEGLRSHVHVLITLTCVDSDWPLRPPFKLRKSKWCSISSLTIIEYSSN